MLNVFYTAVYFQLVFNMPNCQNICKQKYTV